MWTPYLEIYSPTPLHSLVIRTHLCARASVRLCVLVSVVIRTCFNFEWLPPSADRLTQATRVRLILTHCVLRIQTCGYLYSTFISTTPLVSMLSRWTIYQPRAKKVKTTQVSRYSSVPLANSVLTTETIVLAVHECMLSINQSINRSIDRSIKVHSDEIHFLVVFTLTSATISN